MTPLPNPRDTYKALLLDYDALLAASDKECSYCLSEREVQMLLAFVEYIGWKTRYIATETEIDRELIAHWSANLARKLMSGCCGDDGVLHRFTEQGIYQSSDDGGTTWHDDPEGDPRNQATGAPPLPGDASDAKRCAAADNVRDLFEQYRDNLIEIVGATPTVLAIIAGILAFIGTILGLTGVGIAIGVLFLTFAAEVIQLGGTGISGAITFTVLQNFRCLVYCRMNEDGELTYEAWQGLLSDIANTFSGFTEHFFYQTIAGMGYIGVNNAATMGQSTADDCGDCGCANCSNLDAWSVIYGTIIEQSPGYLKIAAGDNGFGQKSVRVSTGLDLCCINDCCFVTFNNLGSGAIQNSNYFACGSTSPAGTVPDTGACGWDFNFVNIFAEDFTVELFFTDCP